MAAVRPVRILCAFEDRAFENIVIPLATRIAAEERRAIEIVSNLTNGCKFEALATILRDLGDGCPLWLIGADTGRESSAGKERAMRRRLRAQIDGRTLVFALAEPSAEGWIQADLAALKRGLSDAIGRAVTLHDAPGPYPRTEPLAKTRLRELVVHATGAKALRGGLEYASWVMAHVPFDAHPSLEAFVRSLRAALKSS